MAAGSSTKPSPILPPNSNEEYNRHLRGGRRQHQGDHHGTDAKSNPLHTEWTGKFDARPYRLTRAPDSDFSVYTLVYNHALTFQNKRAGKVVIDRSVKSLYQRVGSSTRMTSTTEIYKP